MRDCVKYMLRLVEVFALTPGAIILSGPWATPAFAHNSSKTLLIVLLAKVILPHVWHGWWVGGLRKYTQVRDVAVCEQCFQCENMLTVFLCFSTFRLHVGCWVARICVCWDEIIIIFEIVSSPLQTHIQHTYHYGVPPRAGNAICDTPKRVVNSLLKSATTTQPI